MLRLPDRRELLDYAEGAGGQDADVQKQILKLLASSPLMREQLAELKQDLYLVSAQVPDYTPPPELGAEVAKVAQAWASTVYARKFSLRNFYRSREFFGLLIFLCGLTALVLTGLAVYLWR